MLKRDTEVDCLLGKKNSVVNGRGVNPRKGKCDGGCRREGTYLIKTLYPLCG